MVKTSLFAWAPRPGPIKYVVLMIGFTTFVGLATELPRYDVKPNGDISIGTWQ